jgi:diguanylate cyclase (GGDEF)-like protein
MLHNPTVIEMNLFEETKERGFRDALTGLRNYRYFAEYLGQEIARCDQYNTPVSLMLIDVDRFKLFNDGHGHEAGNRVLAQVARLMTACVRRSDTLARYGGEEFALILPQTPKDAAIDVAERLRSTIEGHRFDLGAGAPRESLTISLGLAACPADARVADGLIRCADAALYGAKTEGRNRLQIFGNSRRSYARVATAVKGRFLVADGTFRPLTTVSLSAGGMLFVTDREVRPGALIDARLEIPGSSDEIALSGRVIAVNPCGSGVETSVRTIDLPAGDRKLLSDYLRSVEAAGAS